MATVISSGTVTTNGTEQTLATDTTNKTYVLVIDTSAMALNDKIKILIYTKVLSGGAEGIAYRADYANVQGEPIKYSVPVPANISCKVTITRVSGTDRSYPWSLLSL